MEAFSLESKLLAKFDSSLSVRKWRRSEGDRATPTLQRRLMQYAIALMEAEGLYAQSLWTVMGAYVPLVWFVERIICFEIDLHRLEPWPPVDSQLNMKVSVDGRILRGHSNVGLFISFDESSHSQSPDGVYTWALANMREPELAHASFWTEIGIDEDIALLRGGSLQIGNVAVKVDPYLCGDWKGLSYVVGYAPANSASGDAQICGWCDADKGFLRAGWQEVPFMRPVEIWAKRVQEIPSLPIWRTRYCAMHGVNRLLDNALRLLQSAGHRKELEEIVSRVCPHWGTEGALRPFETKRFFSSNRSVEIVGIFSGGAPVTLPQQEGESQSMPIAGAVRRLLSACKIYFDFSHLRQPTNLDLQLLGQARNDILAVWHGLAGELTPTVHYMTSHFITFAELDGGAYNVLQEGAENHHKSDRETGRHLFNGVLRGANLLQQLLNQQDLHRVLRQRAVVLSATAHGTAPSE